MLSDMISLLRLLLIRLTNHGYCKISVIIANCRFDQFSKPGCVNADVQRQVLESLLTSKSPVVEDCLKPDFIRLAPPLHIAEDEVSNL